VALSTFIVFKIFRFFGYDEGIRGRGEEAWSQGRFWRL
jgi:hypothetical protein